MGYVCCTYEERKGITGFCWGNVRERIYLEGTWGRWEDNIKMDLQELVCGVMEWIKPAQDR